MRFVDQIAPPLISASGAGKGRVGIWTSKEILISVTEELVNGVGAEEQAVLAILAVLRFSKSETTQNSCVHSGTLRTVPEIRHGLTPIMNAQTQLSVHSPVEM